MTVAVIGDSIALGIAEYLRPPAYVSARIGAGSLEVAQYPTPTGEAVIISVGSNDPMNYDLGHNLHNLRRRIMSKRVIWVLPTNERARRIVSGVAREYKDPIITFAPGADGLHPKNYGEIIKKIKENL